MTDAKEPPYPADTRAKGWRFELDLERVKQSDTWALAPAEARPWLFMLWCESWLQTPCGSLPSDECLIAARIGIPSKSWCKYRTTLLRGWWIATDGRQYHPVISELVSAMLKRKDAERTRKAEYRARMDAERDAMSRGTGAGQTLDSHGTDATGTGTGTSTGLKEVSKATPSHPPASADGQSDQPTEGTIPCPYQAIVDAYHKALPGLPTVKLMPAKRQGAMRKLWGWVLSSKKGDGTRRASNRDEALAWIAGYFGHAANNDFLMGRSARTPEHAGWQCDIDFLLSEKGMKQVIEKTQAAA